MHMVLVAGLLSRVWFQAGYYVDMLKSRTPADLIKSSCTRFVGRSPIQGGAEGLIRV